MAAQINYAQLLADPEALKQLQEAQAAAMAQTPMQPEVQGIEEPKMSASFSMTSLPQSEKEIQAAIRQKFMEAQAQQEEQVKQHQDALAKEMQRQEQLGVLGRLDLRPFAQALQQYGSTTAVVPTEAPKDRTAVIEKLREQIQKGQRGLTEDQLGFLKTMMEDKRSGQLGMSLRNAAFREMKEGITPYIKLNTEAEKAISEFKPMERVFSQEQIPLKEITTMVTQFGKRMGEVGNQAEGDRKAYWDPDLGTQLLAAVQKASGNKQTISRNDPNIEAMINAMNTSKEAMADKITAQGTYMKDLYGTPDSPIGYMFQKGKQGDVAHSKLMDTTQKIKALQFGATKQKKAPIKDIDAMSKEELKAYLGE